MKRMVGLAGLMATLALLVPAFAQEQETAVVASYTTDEYGDVLVDGDGRALYLFTADSADASTCTDQCAQAWPPLLSSGEPQADKGVAADLLGTIDRPDGSAQVSYNGHPLYYFVRDQNPGDTNGQGVEGFGGSWYLVTVDGEPAQEQARQQETGGAATGGATTGGAATGGAATGGAETGGAATGGAATGGAQRQQGQAGHAGGEPGSEQVSIPDYQPVTQERLLNPEPENWLMYKRTYDLQGYSPLDQIDTENVTDLVPVWTFSTGVTAGHEAPPIVNDGIMFVTGAFNTLFALDAATGDLLWEYRRELPDDVVPEVCCDVVNRGVALYQDKLYMATLDAHLLAFDAATGNIVWDRTVEDYLSGYVMTLAPLVADGKVMVGASGGEYGIRGFIAAFDAESGEPVWRTYTIPEPGEPGNNEENDTWPGDTWQTGGASIWVTGSYDPELNLTYWGTGNGGPWMGEARPGDNLYISSVVALDVDTGEIKAHYQYVPNESWDYDEISDQTLVDVERDGKMIKGLIHAGRDGIFYLLDRTNLDFIYGEPYTESNMTITGFEEDGRPIIDEARVPGIDKPATTCPVTGGANNWYGLAYSPDTGYAYVPTMEYCMTITGAEATYQVGQNFTGAQAQRFPPEGQDWTGALQAIDVATGKQVWTHQQQMPVRSAVMPTAGGLVFAGDVFSREFRAFDAETGDILWRFKANSGIVGVPTSYEVDGTQYVAVLAGFGGAAANYVVRAADAFNVPYTPAQGGVVWVFALKGQGGATRAQGQDTGGAPAGAGETGGTATGGAQTGGTQ